MLNKRSTQQGITFIGLVFVLGFIAILVVFAVRVFPLYNEKIQIVAAMNSLANRPDSGSLSVDDIRKSFLKNLNATTNINRFNSQNLKEHVEVVKGEAKGDPKQMRVHYEATNKLVADLQLLLVFDEYRPLNEGKSD